MKTRAEYTCPLELTHDIMRGKWKPIIIWQLGYGRTSLSKLEHDIVGINQKMLLQQLKELQEFDLVDKKQFEGYPLRVEYFLTERGERMMDVIRQMQEIGLEIIGKKL